MFFSLTNEIRPFRCHGLLIKDCDIQSEIYNTYLNNVSYVNDGRGSPAVMLLYLNAQTMPFWELLKANQMVSGPPNNSSFLYSHFTTLSNYY